MPIAPIWGLGAASLSFYFAHATRDSVPALSLWAQLTGEQTAAVLLHLMDNLPATLMALAALVTASRARREARATADKLDATTAPKETA